MNLFFHAMGRMVSELWKRENFSLESFPEIARVTLETLPPCDRVDLDELIRDFLLEDEQPSQTHSGFGQPEIIVYEHPRFYIQLLFWMEGTTAIHQHEFSGAFHVMAGSSIHAAYQFENARAITPHFRVGDLKMTELELLETGRTVPISSGSGCIHSLFHLDSPSVTVVLRTQHDPGTGPQFNYLPPHIALDPVFQDHLTLRRRQLLDIVERTDPESYVGHVQAMLKELDFERGFFILQHAMDALQDAAAWEETLGVFASKHGRLARGVRATLEEESRRNVIRSLRGSVTDPDHRFFLALLMNVPSRDALLALVADAFPGRSPEETVLQWLGELIEPSDDGMVMLDAWFPEASFPMEDQADLFLAAFDHFSNGAPAPEGVRSSTLKKLKKTFSKACFRTLLR